jgi:catechol 2,3-dioxygenase-like lactoylglutathione lyase family enzyme
MLVSIGASRDHARMSVSRISAVTFAVRDMRRTVEFYTNLGFSRIYASHDGEFTTVQAGDALVNLVLRPGYEGQWWGRTIFRVESADAQYAEAISAGIAADPPLDAPWGERYFHVTDPDGHELSFAEQLPGQN